MRYTETGYAKIKIFVKPLKSCGKKVIKYCAKNLPEYAAFVKKQTELTVKALDNEFLPAHYRISATVPIPVLADKAASLLQNGADKKKYAEEIKKEYAALLREDKLLYADTALFAELKSYSLIIRAYACAVKNRRDEFKNCIDLLIFPAAHDIELTDSIERVIGENEEYKRLCASSKADCKKQIAIVSYAADIDERRLCIQYLTRGEQGEDIVKAARDDYYRVFPPPSLKKYLFALFAPSVILPSAAAALTQNALWLLMTVPFYCTVKYICDKIIQRFYRKRYFLPPRAELDGKIPPECRTLCVISTLLTAAADVSAAVKKAAEFLDKNRTDNLQVCILADLPPADSEKTEADKKIKAALKAYAQSSEKNISFYLRRRTYNEKQKKYMGYERKRGAIEQLARYFNEGGNTFGIYGGILEKPVFFLVLDYDTNVPIDNAAALVEYGAARANRPVIENGRVTDGYAAFIPQMSPSLFSCTKSRFAGIFGGSGGSSALSYNGTADFYMTVFGEGIFCGKGLIDLDAFYRTVCGVFPENKILSHDIAEGNILRCAAVDVCCTESFPADSTGYFARLSRWQRGDIQNAPFIFKRTLPFCGLDRYKLADNLLRALSPIFTLAAALCADSLIVAAAAVTAILPFIPFSPPRRRYLSTTLSDIKRAAGRIFCEAALIARNGTESLIALLLTLWRMIRNRNLLCWTTSFQIAGTKNTVLRTVCGFLISEAAALAILSGGVFSPVSFIIGMTDLSALPVFILLDKQSGDNERGLSENRKDELKKIAAAEVKFLLEYTNADSNYLPPDNLQLFPSAKPAQRTSPTNTGMYLLALYCALLLDIIDESEYEKRTLHTLDTVCSLKKYKGHLYNWYDTKTLMPLDDFVSSVDSGNFLCCITCIAAGLKGRFENIRSVIYGITDAADMGVFYNKKASLLYIGINARTEKPAENMYDLFMSEARMASYYGICKGQLQSRHWQALSRAAGSADGYTGCLSWSGTVFEYFMPQLVLPLVKGSLCDENLRFAVHCQKKAGHKRLYGISESGFYAFDKELNYQYRAFGAWGAALRPDYFYEKVYSPYSAFLMLCAEPEQSFNLLEEYRRQGFFDNVYGFYEAVDMSDERADTVQPVKSFMAHHKGMSTAALTNAVMDNILVKNFMSDKDMKRGRDLTEERITDLQPLFSRQRRIPRPKSKKTDIFADSTLSGLLTNGSMSVVMLPPEKVNGGAAVHTTVHGNYLFYPPIFGQYTADDPFISFDTAVCTEGMRLSFRGGEFYGGSDCGIYKNAGGKLSISEKITLDASLPVQTHEFCVTDTDSAPRTLNLTVYMRPALGKADALTAHMAFSDLFLSCEYDSEDKLIIVSRKDRDTLAKSYAAISFDADADFFVCFDREGTDITRPLSENRLKCVPAPCVYISLPFTLNGGLSLKMNICYADEKQTAINLAAAARAKSDNAKADNAAAAHTVAGGGALSEVIARTVLPYILLSAKGIVPLKAPDIKLSRLWRYGINTARPVLLFTCKGDGGALHAVLRAARRLKVAGLRPETVILTGTAQYERIRSTAARSFGQEGGLTVIDANTLSDDERALLEYCCCYYAACEKPTAPFNEKPAASEKPLEIWSGICRGGKNGFTEKGYKIAQKPPVPWCKVLANPVFGALVFHNSLGFCWAENSALNTLSPRDDDMTGRCRATMLYIRERDIYTDILAGCTAVFKGGTAEYTAMTDSADIRVTVAVPAKGQAQIIRVRALNRTDKAVTVSPVLMIRLNGLNTAEQSGDILISRRLSDDEFFGIFTLKAFGGEVSYGTDSASVLCGRLESGRAADCMAAQCGLDIPAGETAEAVFIITYCSRHARPSALTDIVADPAFAPVLTDGGAMAEKRDIIRTGDKKLDIFINEWLPEQIINGRIYARTGFYQSGGAYGFRDQLQDGMAAAYIKPSVLRRLIYLCCASQFIEGDVLHWFHVTENGKMGVRTACSDDMLWLALACCHYISLTGDKDILYKEISCCTAAEYSGREFYGKVGKGKKYTVLEHCLAAADYAYKLGGHGLCLIGSGDWNDSFNLVGAAGRGESVWLSMFTVIVYNALLALPKGTISQERQKLFSDRISALKASINENAYENGYYIRGFYDNGEKLGAQGNKYCEIDILTQSFAVLCGLNDGGDISRSVSAVNCALSRLCDNEAGIIRLFSPPFDLAAGEKNLTGYVCAYPKGVRENGGQYTHAAIWLCMAVNRLGYKSEAQRMLKMLCPVYKDSAVYKKEPYYMCADVYTHPDCYGQGGWSLYTGAAGWYYRAAREIFGVE